LIEEFQLGSEVDRKVQDLSGGFRRRVQVAKVFMVDTPVLFLDEFSTGMDPILKRQVMNSSACRSREGKNHHPNYASPQRSRRPLRRHPHHQQGKTDSRAGDLNTLKLLSHGVYEITLAFDHLPENIQAEIAALSPIRSTIEATRLISPSKSKRTASWTLSARSPATAMFCASKVRGASLEDIFVELPRGKGRSWHERHLRRCLSRSENSRTNFTFIFWDLFFPLSTCLVLVSASIPPSALPPGSAM